MTLPTRAFPAVFLVAAAILLAACSGGKPESTVEAFYRAAAKGNVEKAIKQISFAEVPAAQITQARGKIQMIVGEMQGRVQANGGLDGVETLQSEIDPSGKEARVRSRLKFKNGKDMTEQTRLVKEDGGWKILLR